MVWLFSWNLMRSVKIISMQIFLVCGGGPGTVAIVVRWSFRVHFRLPPATLAIARQ